LENVQIDIAQLAEYVDWKMRQERLSLREAAEKAGVSAPTLSRIRQKRRNGPRPDVDTLVKVIRWVGVPIDKIVGVSAAENSFPSPRRNTMEEIEVHLRADKNLSAEAAEAIARMVRVAYAQFASKPRSRR